VWEDVGVFAVAATAYQVHAQGIATSLIVRALHERLFEYL